MKLFLLFYVLLTISLTNAYTQKTIRLHELWEEPQVHVHYDNYTISFKIRDYDRTLALLNEHHITRYGKVSDLDTNEQYNFFLYPDNNMEYHNGLEQLTQNVIGPFLLLSGRAYIRKGRKKELSAIIADIAPSLMDDSVTYINFFDPTNKKLIFSGSIATEMIHEDLGLDLPGY